MATHNMAPPGSVMLAKVKGYSAWPAMVLDPDLLPENISALKPKNGINFTPVRFFADDTYIWIKNADLRELSVEVIQDYLKKHDDEPAELKNEDDGTNSMTSASEVDNTALVEPETHKPSKVTPIKKAKKKSKKEVLLLEAYKLANSPPPMDTFVKYGSLGEPPTVEDFEAVELEEESISESMEQDDFIEDEVETPKKSRKRDVSSNPKTPAKKQKTSNASVKTKGKATPAKKGATSKKKNTKQDTKKLIKTEKLSPSVEDDGYDSDWGVEETIEEQRSEGNYVFENAKEQQRFISTFPASQDIVNLFNKYKSIFELLEIGLTRDLLLQEKGFEKEVKLKLNEVEKIVDHIPKVLINKSRLLKVLIVTVRNPNFGDDSLRAKIQSLLQSKFGITVRVNNEDDFQKIDDDIKKYNGTNTSTPVSISVNNSTNSTPAP
ncbi:uncharacterized protein KQ657_003628 [Scheffersomyces spartinae]|uniref:PWWP domain-containing protein n=1 Tax=Scheffersomyces spartinae TaxID=45513 RepID=A0A9P8AKG0_9ASCO|nr:uncharacterized protein KQ657_003628 [Scheffersomyces spartinae]KAG7195107.1 hypothetical protein KQ657_003628 [Scheffersomyces spartinae]